MKEYDQLKKELEGNVDSSENNKKYSMLRWILKKIQYKIL